MDEFNVNRDPFCQVGQMCDHRIHKYTRSENESSSLRKIETFSIEKYARRMCVFAGALWLPCFMDNCIMVYSLDGVLLQVIETYRINKPLGICVFDKGHLLVAAANGLFLMDDPPRGMNQTIVHDTVNHGSIVTEVRQGSFCDVFILNPHILALEYKQGRVYIDTYKTQYNRLVKTTTSFNLNYETDYLDTIHMKDSHVFVTSCTQHCVIKYNMKGVVITKYGVPGGGADNSLPGSLHFPSICNTLNRLGLILIADALHGRLQALDPDSGAWCVLHDRGVAGPVDAVLADDDTMMVLSGKLNHYKVHKFQILIPHPDDSKQTSSAD